MTVYELHTEFHQRDFDKLPEELQKQFRRPRGLWYASVQGIETMTAAVRALKNYTDNHPEYRYRIVQVHYTTRQPLQGKVKE